MRDTTGILIVGAGPVGLTAALELARRGYRPRIIDRKDGPTAPDESRALAINQRTLQLLAASGVSQRIVAEGHQIVEMRMTAGNRRLLTIDTCETVPELPPNLPVSWRGLYTLPQGETESILIDRLKTFSIAPEWNRNCVRLESADNAATVVLERPDGSQSVTKAPIVIGADGAYSTIRREAGFSFPGNRIDQTFHLADYSYAEEFDSSYVEAMFLDPGTLARIPISARHMRYVSTLADFRNRIQHPAAIGRLLWQSEFEVSFRHVDSMHRGCVFLAGDAAHVHSPVGGRGMNLGIEDACWLAWLISQDREKDYSGLRIPAVKQVLNDTFRNTRLVLATNPFAIAARNFFVPLLARNKAVRMRGLRNVLGLDTAAPAWLDGQNSEAET